MYEKVKSETRITRLLDSAKSFSAFLELRSIFSAMAAEIINIVRYDAAMILLLSEDRERLEVIALDSSVRMKIREGSFVSTAKTLIGTCVAEKKGFVVPDISSYKDASGVSHDFTDTGIFAEGRIVSGLVLPILFENEIIGVFFACSRTAGVFSESELELFERLTLKLSSSIHESYLYKRIRESEDMYRVVVENVQDGLFIVHDEKIIFANDVFAKMVGYTPRDMFGMNIRKFTAPEDRDWVSKRYSDRLSGRDVPGKYEFRLLHRDGKTRIPVHINVSLVEYKGKTTSVGTLKDLSEIKTLQENLIRTERLASAGLIAGSIAHEINNPLGIIHGFVEHLIAHTPHDDERYEDLKIVLAETQKCSGILKNLLNNIKVQPLTVTPTKLRPFVDETLFLLEKKFEEKKIAFSATVPAELPVVTMDFFRFRQVLINVLLNSIQSTPEGGSIRFVVEVADNGHGHNELRFIAEDNGEGVPAEYVDKIFEPFFSLKKQGTGLGLFTSKLIVEAHGGTISFESEFRKGSRCTIKIPV